MADCLNCGTRFTRRPGRKFQKFCREDCWREFARVALAYVEEAMAAGLLSLDRLREGVQSNAAFVSRGGRGSPGSDHPPPASPEPPGGPPAGPASAIRGRSLP